MKPTEEFLARYRAVGLERLARVETAWFAISQGAGSTQMTESLRRDLHTLKGDSTLLGFDGVSKLCQRLEDLVSVATDREYDIGDELDHLVTMALQFTGMILRAPSATGLTGIDLPGFLSQVDDSLARTRDTPSRDVIAAANAAASGSGRSRTRDERPSGRMSVMRSGDAIAETRERLAIAATSSFIEYCNARGKSRARLRNLWLLLKHEVEVRCGFPVVQSDGSLSLAYRPGRIATAFAFRGTDGKVHAELHLDRIDAKLDRQVAIEVFEPGSMSFLDD